MAIAAKLKVNCKHLQKNPVTNEYGQIEYGQIEYFQS